MPAPASSPLQIRQARGFWMRLKGLIGSADPRAHDHSANATRDALLIQRCTSMHTCFMRYALDIIYLDNQGHITRLVAALAPWRCSRGGPGAAHVLELPAGAIASQGLRPGMQLQPWPMATGAVHQARFLGQEA